jgi:hypothetical protein
MMQQQNDFSRDSFPPWQDRGDRHLGLQQAQDQGVATTTVIYELYFALIEARASPQKSRAEAAADVALWRRLEQSPDEMESTP